MPQDILKDLSAKIDANTGVTSAPNTAPGSTPAAPAAPAKASSSTDGAGPEATPTLWDAFTGVMSGKPDAAARYATQAMRDAPGALWNGVTNAVNEVGATGEKLGNAVNDAVGWTDHRLGIDSNFTKWYRDENLKKQAETSPGPLVPKGVQADEPKTGVGQTLQAITQLGVGIVGVGKFMAPLEGVEGAGIVAKVALGAAKTAAADMAVMNPYQNRLSSIMENAPWIGPTIKQYLSADPTDSYAEAKLKQGLEGFVVGVPLEALVGAAKVVKASRLFTTPGVDVAEARAAVSDAANNLDKAINKAHAAYSVEPQADGTFRVRNNTAPAPGSTLTPGLSSEVPPVKVPPVNVPPVKPSGDLLERYLTTGKLGAEEAPPVVSASASSAGRYTMKPNGSMEFEVFDGAGKSQGQYATREAASEATDKLNEAAGQPTRATVRPPETPAEQATAAAGRQTTSTMSGDATVVGKQAAEPLYHPQTFTNQAEAEAEAAILNTSWVENQRMNPPTKPWTQAQLDAYKTTVGNIDSPEKFNELLQNGDGADFNFHRIHGEADAKIQLDTLAKIQREGLDSARGGEVVSHTQTIAIAKSMFPGEDPEAFVGRLTRVFKNTQDLAAHLLAGKSLMILQARRMHQLATLADGIPESPAAMSRLVGGLEEFYHTVAATKSIQSNAARAVEIGKVDASSLLESGAAKATGGLDNGMTVLERQTAAQGAEAVQARKALIAIHGMSYDQLRMLTRRLAIAGGDPQGILGAVYSIPTMPKPLSVFGFQGPGKALQQGTEWLINSLISGVHTLSVVNTSMGLNYLIKPVEMMGAGAYQAIKDGSLESGAPLRQEGWQTLAATYKSVWDSIHLASQAFKNGSPILDSSDAFTGTPQYIGGDIGTLARLPSRLHMATNEFWQQMGYRANATAAALKEAGDAGVKNVEQFVNDRLDASFAGPNRTGRALDKARLDYARDLTYSQDLPQGSWPQTIQRAIAEHPAAKVVAPFTLKPANLMYWSWDRTPGINLLHQSFREDLQAGGERGARAAAKMGTGLALWGAAAGLALAGKITGKRPFNPALTNQANSMDLPPEYSLNLGTNENPNWVSYKQAEPIAGPVKLGGDFLGIVADVSQASGEMSVHPIKNIGVATATMLSNAFVSETYFTSLVNFMSAAGSSDPNAWDKFIRNEGAAMVPNVLNSFNPDPYVREIRSVTDAELAKTPGFSEQLPPRYNVLGEPALKPPGIGNRMLPFVMSGKGNGDLESSMLRLGKAIPMPAQDKDGVDLTTDQFGRTKSGLTPYDRMMQLIGQPKNGNTNLRDDMTENLLHNQAWTDMPDSATKKFDMAAHMAEKHRSTAEKQMLEEFPGLADFITQSKQGKNAAKREGDDGIRRVLGMTQSPNQ